MIVEINKKPYFAMGRLDTFGDCTSCDLDPNRCDINCREHKCNYLRAEKQMPKKAKRWFKK